MKPQLFPARTDSKINALQPHPVRRRKRKTGMAEGEGKMRLNKEADLGVCIFKEFKINDVLFCNKLHWTIDESV